MGAEKALTAAMAGTNGAIVLHESRARGGAGGRTPFSPGRRDSEKEDLGSDLLGGEKAKACRRGAGVFTVCEEGTTGSCALRAVVGSFIESSPCRRSREAHVACYLVARIARGRIAASSLVRGVALFIQTQP